MQPPPRKGNYAKFLKNVHGEQAAKLAAKNQHECDLLEDIRNFTLKKSAIEKSYSEALLKISSAYLNKKIPNIPDLKIDNADEKWNMWNVWRTVLEENEKLARARLAAVEVFQQQIADDAKVLRMHKMQISKKAIDQLLIVQKELQTCVQDVDKTKKLYHDEEHSAHDVRDKAKDIEEKLKKKKGSFFQSITSLQKNSAKVTSKRDALEEKSTGARNDYLLSLAAANAHQNRYFAVDLQTTMQYLEQNVYDKVQEYLTLMGRTELLTCMATQNSFGKIRDQAQQYDFEACDSDPIDRVTADHSAATSLGKEARRWSSKIAREVSNIRENTRKLHAMLQLKESGQKANLDTKIDELKHNIRRAETAKMKAEARIECLRAGGVNVDEFLQEAETLSVQDMPRSASSLSVRTDASGAAEHPSSDSFYDSDNDAGSDLTTVERPGSARHSSQHEDEVYNERERHDSAEVDALLEEEKQRMEQTVAGWDDPTQIDWGTTDEKGEEVTDTAAEVSDPNAGLQLFKCTALYSYTAQNPDELSIVESEQLEVVGEGDGDGWLRARNYRGEEGFVPQNYLDVEREAVATTGLTSQPGLVTQISFSSVDYTIDDHDAVDPDAHLHAQQEPVPQEPEPEPESEPEPQQQQQQQQEYQQQYVPEDPGASYCIALYDYDATCDEELTFMEGDVLKIIKTEPHDVDDGWWEGELHGRRGLFPSLVVEPCAPDGAPLTPEESMTPPSSAPPVFTPPEVPEYALTEELALAFAAEEEKPSIINGEVENFSMTMSRDQKSHYGSQFDETGAPGIVVVQVSDEGDKDPQDEKVIKDGDRPKIKLEKVEDDGGLGVAQIVITAATPMEEIERPFPGEEDDKQDGSEEEEKKVVEEVVKEEIIKEEIKEQEHQVTPPNEEVEEKSTVDDLPADSAPFPISSSSGSEADSTSGPSTADNSASLPSRGTVIEMQVENNETSDEQPDIIPEKMLIGGRASIPDELQPDQLEKLQNLKESNA
ncbi:Similar to nwk: Protein nervous wreck (Drosophila melanogaster) [Cotesia congregata]|uniref:Similar to nwk: Protein nervous wreck (Drosophila melanogaster) n=1 Tax=Cotesia congregata TaxID=51543 RepID=A0A8J2H993_COTCN|nr:Similar to nwk: Protein nervous wreck (Drosophila melanogaster) [Cotesia congregata]